MPGPLSARLLRRSPATRGSLYRAVPNTKPRPVKHPSPRLCESARPRQVRDCRPDAERETLVTMARDQWRGDEVPEAPNRAESPVQLGERRRYLDVAEEVLRAVAVGTIGAGDRLPNERELAERCDVSRATVREAILALELGGVVEVRPGSGTYLTGLGVPSANLVAPTVDSSPRELLHARQIIEPAVVQLCAMRI